MLWIEAPTTEKELEKIVKELHGYPVLLNWLEGGRTPQISIERIRDLGFALVLFPIGSVLIATAALRQHYQYVRTHGTPFGPIEKLMSFDEFQDVVGLEEIKELEQHFR